MKNLLYKEFRLFLVPLNYLFLTFTLMVFIPGGYPILVSCFFIMMSVFISFQLAREHNDVLYSVLLPVKKGDAVKARFLSVVTLQGISVLLFAAFVAIRMTLLRELTPYAEGQLMPGNLTFLGFVFLSYALFNGVFVCGFYKTAYNYAKPFILYIVFFFLLVGAEETLGFLPGCTFLRGTGGSDALRQLPVLLAGIAVYAAVTVLSAKKAVSRFAVLDI